MQCNWQWLSRSVTRSLPVLAGDGRWRNARHQRTGADNTCRRQARGNVNKCRRRIGQWSGKRHALWATPQAGRGLIQMLPRHRLSREKEDMRPARLRAFFGYPTKTPRFGNGSPSGPPSQRKVPNGNVSRALNNKRTRMRYLWETEIIQRFPNWHQR